MAEVRTNARGVKVFKLHAPPRRLARPLRPLNHLFRLHGLEGTGQQRQESKYGCVQGRAQAP